MKLLYKSLLFLMIFICSVGSVCAADNTTSDNVTGDGRLSPVNPPINNTTDVSNEPVGHIMTDKEKFEFMDGLYRNNTALNKKVKTLNDKIDKQSIEIKYLKEDNKALKEDNKALKEDNKALKEDNKALKEDIKRLNERLDKKDIEINELNNKLDLQLIEIKQLNSDKDKLQADIKQLNAEKCSIYEKLLESPKKEDYEQLKKDITNKNKDIINKDNKINELNTKIKILNNILSVNRKELCNSLKCLSSTKNIKCGKYTFKLEDYLKIPLIKDGKNRVLKYKKSHGRLPNYVTIAGYDVPKKVYQKLYNL